MKIGVDIVEIKRIKKFIKENDENLMRIFSSEEIRYCQSLKKEKSKNQSFAARFAAKEALIKALDDKTIKLNDISTFKNESGKPNIKINNDKYKDIKIEVSLSHCDNYAIAMVMLY